MRTNRRMKAYLDDLRSREVSAHSLLPERMPGDLELVQAGECVVLRRVTQRPPRTLADLAHWTNVECLVNKLSMNDMVNPRLSRGVPLVLLMGGLLLAERFARQLAHFPGLYNVIVSYDGEGCAVRFHKVRAGERWLLDDLEDYNDEGVPVVAAGAQAGAQTPLLG
ncbi:MAG: hypothetical protein NVS2B9_09150 [Myxococcales bacterium]